MVELLAKRPIGKGGPVSRAGSVYIWGKGAIAGGNFVFVTGCEGKDYNDPLGRCIAPDIIAQTKLAFTKLKNVLEEAGTSLENVVKFTWYVKKREDKQYFLKTRDEFFKEHAPKLLEERSYASTLLVGVELDEPDMLCEVDAIAWIPPKEGTESTEAS
jgi:enamine deaminase RidA (YjgF/YER057c/UK114 family)